MFQLHIQTKDLQSWWKDEKRESLMFIIESLNITVKRWLSHALMISVLTNIFKKVREAYCLIDSKIKWNFILQSWIKKHKLLKNHATLKQIQMIDDHWILCYDTYYFETKSHLLMTHETTLIRLHLEFMRTLTTINRDFSSMTQSHLQNSWEYWLSFIKISQAKFSSSSFTHHLLTSFLDESIYIETYLPIYLSIYLSSHLYLVYFLDLSIY